MECDKKRNKLVTTCFIALFLLTIIKCFLGDICEGRDEAFYLSQANRILQGDVIFLDDWMYTSLYSILLVPFLAVYKLLVGSYESVLLGARLFECLITFLLSIYVYKKLIIDGWNYIHSLAVACLILFFVPNNASGFSYYIIGFHSLLLTIILLYSNDTRRTWIISGFLCGIAILANPYMVFLYTILLICIFLRKHKVGFWIILGPIIEGGLYIAWLLSKAHSVKELIEGIKNYLNIPGYEISGGMKYINKLVLYIGEYAWLSRYVILWIVVAMTIYRILKRDISKKISVAYFYINTIYALANMIKLIIKSDNLGEILFSLSLYCICIIPILNIKKYRKELYYFVLPGIGTMILYLFASQLAKPSAAIGSFFVIMGMSVMIKDYVISNFKKSFGYAYGAIFVAIVFLNIVFLRMTLCFTDTKISELDYWKKDGPAKGIFTVYDSRYEDSIQCLEEMNLSGDDILFSNGQYLYLCTDARCASWSTWDVHLPTDVISKYYKIHPERMPNVMIIYTDYEDESLEIKLIDLLQDMGKNYIKEEHNGFTAYYEKSEGNF